ncbi:unnamed protein product [Protopolystoma xenopodis]|uniref:Uncharacterized protein n=1 Tax=Protopolystoma xenopodis TaxID=117903 RepID=A0A448WPT4_9PLAT|nr:unnamed protein product [Protopolystoma xenopodis]
MDDDRLTQILQSGFTEAGVNLDELQKIPNTTLPQVCYHLISQLPKVLLSKIFSGYKTCKVPALMRQRWEQLDLINRRGALDKQRITSVFEYLKLGIDRKAKDVCIVELSEFVMRMQQLGRLMGLHQVSKRSILCHFECMLQHVLNKHLPEVIS